MRIQHNIMAMNSYRNFSSNTKSLSKNLEKLSSGYRINRAGDDAAGLAISEKMRAQVTGLKTAQKNAKDGISLVQTAEGALTEVHSMLNRMVELADQSANGTYDDTTDRANLQEEFNALRSEVDRISKATNFNGIKLLNGDQKQTLNAIGSALNPAPPTTTDNQVASAGSKAKFEIKLDGTTATTGDLAITGGTTTLKELGEMTIDNVKISDLFTATVGGVAVDFTATTAIASGANLVFEAKTAGELSDAAMTALKGIGKAASLSVTDGVNVGGGSSATSSTYKLDFDFATMKGGTTFTIGDKTFELSTSGAKTDAANILIDLKNIDLTAAGGSNAAGQWKAAAAIRTAVNTAFTADFNVDAEIGAAPAGNKFTLNFSAKVAGDAGNKGQVRVSGAGVTSTYVAGKLEGKATPGKFATASYELDLDKLALGDKLNVGAQSLEVVKDEDEDLANGKIGQTKAKVGAEVIKTLEGIGYNSGKLAYGGGKLTITAKESSTTAEQLTATAGAGKVSVTVKNPGTSSLTGGLTLQIGEDSEVYNQITVSIDNMNCESLGIDATKINIGGQPDAAAAVAVLKKSINTVSGTRGDLGALQNRLDHTINNLSVMAENIQDAEASIRDVDVAEEMMAYTKNNILVQSAQAMLAQANQVPQGVLQLLQ